MAEQRCSRLDERPGTSARKLMASGTVRLGQSEQGVEVRRGMVIVAQEGKVLGLVAGVLMHCCSQRVTHILLGCIPPTAEYRLIPLTFVARVGREQVWLQASLVAVAALPCYESG